MRVHLTHPALMASLLEFLRARDCIVEQVGEANLSVWCPPDDCSRGSGTICRSCGAPVAEALGRLGSLRCHDCRDQGGFETLLAGIYAHANGNGHLAKARVALAAYLAEWQAQHPEARAAID
jgi:hypothetical protein